MVGKTARAGSASSTETSSNGSEAENDCRDVVAEYFEVTGKALTAQVEQCDEIAVKLRSGAYTAEDAQHDWQAYVERTTKYCGEVSRLYLDGWSKCARLPTMTNCFEASENGSKN